MLHHAAWRQCFAVLACGHRLLAARYVYNIRTIPHSLKARFEREQTQSYKHSVQKLTLSRLTSRLLNVTRHLTQAVQGKTKASPSANNQTARESPAALRICTQ